MDIFNRPHRVDVRAPFVGERLNMKALEQSRRLTVSPFVTRAGADGYAVLFRYGVVALLGLNALEEAAAAHQAIVAIGRTVQKQAYVMAFSDAFFLLGATLIIALAASLLLEKPKRLEAGGAH